MTIELLDEYKSLYPFRSEELNVLTIITGKNGSGKSQLLELIGKKANNEVTVSAFRLTIKPERKKVQYEGLIKANSAPFNFDSWKAIIQHKLNEFNRLGVAGKELLTYFRLNPMDTSNPNNFYSPDEAYKVLLSKVWSEIHGGPVMAITQIQPFLQNQIFNQTVFTSIDKHRKFIREVCERTRKKESELVQADFYSIPVHESLIDNDDFFNSQIELIFYNYAKRRDENARAYFEKREYGDENNAVSDEEFIKQHCPPWKLMNDILERHNIDFEFLPIERKFEREAPLDFRMVKKSLGKAIDFNNLSSGEKVIIGLILKLFTGEYYGSELSFPDLLILDEPDAPLHPEMSKLLIEVLEGSFVKCYRINVLFTTHSPSTIALAPEYSIYQLQNGPTTKLTKISKDEALKILTSFIPTLSIDYHNHRQVFVESPTDVNYYQTVFNKRNQQGDLHYKLYFISNAAGKGNCSQVYDIVRSLRMAGNRTAYGIADWDSANLPTDEIYVHGEGERYSVENFIVDPFYVAIALMHLNNAHDICRKVGLNLSDNEYLIGEKRNEELQTIADKFFKEIQKVLPALNAEQEVTLNYFNNKDIRVPCWFVIDRGHEIVERLKKVFPALQKFRNEGDFQQVLINIMSKCYPFVPKSSVELIEKLAIQA